MVRVNVRQRDQGKGSVLDLAQDAAPGETGGGVDQHVRREVDVDRVRGEPPKLPQVGRELLQAGAG
jgi:hypothetical protein